MRTLLLSAIAGTLVAMSGAAWADTLVSADRDLNMRAGPGSRYPVVGVLAAGQTAVLDGCLQGSKWCAVGNADNRAWINSDYVTSEFSGRRVVLTERPVDSGVTVIETPGVVMDDELSTGSVVQDDDTDLPLPPMEVRSYVRTNAVDPIYIQDEVRTGATLPDTVVLSEVPGYDYRYAYVNGEPVIVSPSSRHIVYVGE
ncbi:MAG: DUF1236 domain-containing protein [Aquamicrobium sp.]|uniref:DUF1236 domain-containing protein n=1 Tax=Mesorhizobium sp. Pch-S TaxID=2082387 RepID=UPI001013A778|nr:DUF1236 domain-containing protein [Mesorhizobium sp. Pch-S]MBR2690688.1 DUF1236 domain-containing protein [Aquamicrobium sp.]QAZ43605.1 hypothetical protein C1M53_12205 [Mesorhizobium sp. Pch-S]